MHNNTKGLPYESTEFEEFTLGFGAGERPRVFWLQKLPASSPEVAQGYYYFGPLVNSWKDPVKLGSWTYEGCYSSDCSPCAYDLVRVVNTPLAKLGNFTEQEAQEHLYQDNTRQGHKILEVYKSSDGRVWAIAINTLTGIPEVLPSSELVKANKPKETLKLIQPLHG